MVRKQLFSFQACDVQIIQQNMPKAQYKQLGAEGVKYLLEEYAIELNLIR